MRWLLLLCLALALNARAADPPAWFAESFLDIREDVADAAREGRRLMVYFHQDGCPACKQLVEVTWKDPKVVAKARQHFVALAINIWGDREVTWTDGRKMREKEFAAAIGVRATPTVMFFDEKAQVALRFSGYLPPAEFAKRLDAARLARRN